MNYKKRTYKKQTYKKQNYKKRTDPYWGINCYLLVHQALNIGASSIRYWNRNRNRNALFLNTAHNIEKKEYRNWYRLFCTGLEGGCIAKSCLQTNTQEHSTVFPRDR